MTDSKLREANYCPYCGTDEIHSEGCPNGPCSECGRQGEKYTEFPTMPDGDPDRTDCDGPTYGGGFSHPALATPPVVEGDWVAVPREWPSQREWELQSEQDRVAWLNRHYATIREVTECARAGGLADGLETAARITAASYHINTGGLGHAAKQMQDAQMDHQEEVQAVARFEQSIRRGEV